MGARLVTMDNDTSTFAFHFFFCVRAVVLAVTVLARTSVGAFSRSSKDSNSKDNG